MAPPSFNSVHQGTETGELRTPMLNPEQESGLVLQSDDFSFKKMGKTLRLQKSPFVFPPKSVPRQALAVSQKPPALFLAHLTGFYVARIQDIRAEALSSKKQKKNNTVADLGFSAEIGGVRILSVSTDNLILAASVDHKIHFFRIESLVNLKAPTPTCSSSVDESSHVKDFRWTKSKTSEASFLLLSSNGKLYHKTLDGSLDEKMADVDTLDEKMADVHAVDWSTSDDFIAVGKDHHLTILSSSFLEQFTLPIPRQPRTPGFTTCDRKVDSINWIRPDCILLGCSYITKDGDEVEYDIQIISCEYGQISKASSKPVVLSFEMQFAKIRNDLLPPGCGPHLFLNYLENMEVALVANKKNTSEHVRLFCWSLFDDYKKAVSIYFSRDTLHPEIDLQDDWSRNMIVGFGVDEMSLYNQEKKKSGGSQGRFPQDCILFCVTIDAKLLLFSFKDHRENMKTRTATSDEADESIIEPQDFKKLILELKSRSSTAGIKSGEDVGTARRSIQSLLIQPSCCCRDALPFGTLQYKRISQLSAADMAAFYVKQPYTKWKNVVKESVDSHDLDNTDNSVHCPHPVTKLGHCSASLDIKGQSRQNQSSDMKGSSPETVWIDSLDQSGANFEPPKTTAEKTFLQERLPLKTNKESPQQHSHAQLCDHKSSSPSLHSYADKLETNRSEIHRGNGYSPRFQDEMDSHSDSGDNDTSSPAGYQEHENPFGRDEKSLAGVGLGDLHSVKIEDSEAGSEEDDDDEEKRRESEPRQEELSGGKANVDVAVERMVVHEPEKQIVCESEEEVKAVEVKSEGKTGVPSGVELGLSDRDGDVLAPSNGVIVETGNDGEHLVDDQQKDIATSWTSCCGLFDVLTGSNR